MFDDSKRFEVMLFLLTAGVDVMYHVTEHNMMVPCYHVRVFVSVDGFLTLRVIVQLYTYLCVCGFADNSVSIPKQLLARARGRFY